MSVGVRCRMSFRLAAYVVCLEEAGSQGVLPGFVDTE
jgi:hypothetical protein